MGKFVLEVEFDEGKNCDECPLRTDKNDIPSNADKIDEGVLYFELLTLRKNIRDIKIGFV